MSDPRLQVETRRGWRLKMLHSLYEWSEGDPAVVFNDLWTIGEELGIPRDQAFDVAAYLWDEGLAERADMSGGISITHAGVKDVETALSAPAEPTPRFPPARNVIRIERAVNTVIQQGNVGSSQTVHIEAATTAEASALADAVDAALARLETAEHERSEMRAQLEALRAQLAAPKPRLAALRDAVGGVRDVLEGITRTGRAVRDTLPLLDRARALLGRLRE